MKQFDIVIKNGHVIDPLNHVDKKGCDIAIHGGKIAQIGGQNLIGQKEIDASGCMVVPGLIDCHVHVYEHCTQLGVNADETCLARGLFIFMWRAFGLLTYLLL